LAKLANLWLILTQDVHDLANIYIDNRNLIESNRNIEFSTLEKKKKKTLVIQENLQKHLKKLYKVFRKKVKPIMGNIYVP
ncbi:MAG: hypothetical protein ACRCYT_02660, partial [Cetobacterium sp.]